MRLPLTIFLIVFLSGKGWAVVPEYEHLSEDEKTEVNRPSLIGSEYESDRLTYQFLLPWTESWLSNNNVFQYTAGSLGPTRFFTQGRLRMRKQLNEWFDFQLTYVDVGSLKQSRRSLIFEFYLKPTSWWHLSLYGEPSTLKKQDDMGLASTILFSDQSNLRLYYTWVDFSHNKRNEGSDRYTKQPASLGAIWRWFDSGSFIQASVRKDLQTQQVFENGRVYNYSGFQLQWQSRHQMDSNGDQYLQTEFNVLQSSEEDTEKVINSEGAWSNQTLDGLVQIQRPHSWLRLYGLRALYSHWDSLQGGVIHNDLLPHFWVNPWGFTSLESLHHLDFGYEMTWHRAQGPKVFRSTLDRDNGLEHRMNWRYRIVTDQTTHFNLLLTFDLDKFGSGETWEGGSIQFATQF